MIYGVASQHWTGPLAHAEKMDWPTCIIIVCVYVKCYGLYSISGEYVWFFPFPTGLPATECLSTVRGRGWLWGDSFLADNTRTVGLFVCFLC